MTSARRTTVTAATTVVLATAGGLLTATATPATAATTCTSPVFKRQFYANTTFSGTPKKTDCDSAIDQNWGTGAPTSGLPSNNFGVRWTVTRDFGSGGPFTFTASALDGVRVYLDGTRKIDLWKNVSSTVSKTVNVTIPSGKHTLRVDYVNWTGSAKVKFTYTPRTSATVDKVKPLTPTAPAVTYDQTTGAAKFTWAKNKEMDLAGYRVYRRLKGTSFGTKPLATTTSTSYTDTTLPKTGDVYYYEVRAYDKAGNVSTGTADQGVTTVDRTAPAAPAGVEDNWDMGLTTEVKLSWDQVAASDLAGYRVYRSTTYPVVLAEAKLVSERGQYESYYSETPPATGDWYYYVVTAVDTHGNESAASGTAMFETWDRTPPTVVAQDLKAVDGEHDVTLNWSWDQTGGSDPTFKVFRNGAAIGSGYGTSFTDTSVQRSTSYTYTVRAVDGAGNLGPVSASLTVDHVGDYTAPGPVTGLTATPVENGIKLDWDDSAAADVADYRIYRGVYANGEWTYTDISDSLPYGTVWSQNLDWMLPDGESYRYKVVAVDGDGNVLDAASADVPTVGATELDMRPTEATPGDGSPIASLDVDGFGPLIGDEGILDMGWAYDAEQDPNGPATHFRVYRWDPATAAYVKLGDTADASRNSYQDAKAKAGTTLFYRVTAVYADGTESVPVGAHTLT
ncbi:fibronectin type III domain-containing protein [Streptomyces ipomoeae]|uniref:fibronectin type III domain-containing protein n=1 Tax=Streptomyces ipomoeae TaxID=103232 RepID=UPI0011469F21|nr:PA14 domain-containing protein [Streptomyces ipomoeae]MDX2936809.1 PA14 domain-containing protein [Streptomyces ipomoeae]TQE23837.1 hypothetical protein SipoB123_20115 [Streptomyces ipomoeae]